MVTVLSAVCFAAHGDEGPAHLTEADMRVTREAGLIASTYCIARTTNARANRRLAIAGAASALVQWRDGVEISGTQSLQGGVFEERIQESTLGVVGALDVALEDPAGGIAHDLWCVKVVENQK